jgi:hypothetical protein
MFKRNHGLFLEVFCKGHGCINLKIHIRLGLSGMRTHTHTHTHTYIYNCLPSSNYHP